MQAVVTTDVLGHGVAEAIAANHNNYSCYITTNPGT